MTAVAAIELTAAIVVLIVAVTIALVLRCTAFARARDALAFDEFVPFVTFFHRFARTTGATAPQVLFKLFASDIRFSARRYTRLCACVCNNRRDVQQQ